MRKQERIKKRLLSGLLCCAFLSGCTATENVAGAAKEPEEETIALSTGITADEEGAAGIEEMAQEFGAVPYFYEDTNSLLQYADGYLYGYLEGCIFRVDAQTGETTVLAAMRNTASNHFCIDNGYLYFFYIPQVSFIDGIRGDLYRLDLSGTDTEPPVLLAEDVRVFEENTTINGNTTVNMSVYKDVLYIMMEEETVCFRLLADGSVEEIAIEDTLYGLLPEGYSAPWRYDLPSIPYCAAHYGYFFAQNEENFLVRVDAESGIWESIGGEKSYRGAFLTYEGIYLADREKEQWIRYGLEDVSEPAFSPWRDYYYWDMIVGWKKYGVFLLKRQYDSEAGYTMQLLFVDREGGETQLVSFEKQVTYPPPYGIGYYYVRDGWLYYRDQWEDSYWLARIALTGGEPEKLYCYDDNSRSWESIAKTEVVQKNTENTGERRITTSITKLYIKEEHAGDAAINAALRKIYAEAEAELEDDNREIMDDYFSGEEGWPEEWLAASFENYEAYISYADEDYICVGMMGEGFVGGGAHGFYWYDYYVYDRHTGKRLTLQDFVSNSPEEITEIVKAYIVAGYEWTDGSRAEDALEPDRFFLTAEGLGIHYDVYEIGSYADGPFAYIIPFDAFDMKEGMQPGA